MQLREINRNIAFTASSKTK